MAIKRFAEGALDNRRLYGYWTEVTQDSMGTVTIQAKFMIPLAWQDPETQKLIGQAVSWLWAKDGIPYCDEERSAENGADDSTGKA